MAPVTSRLAVVACLGLLLSGVRHGRGDARRPAGRAARGLRPRDHRVHQGAAAPSRTTARRAGRSSAPSCARRSTTITRGRRLAGGGRLDEALVELQLAAELNPGNQDIADTLQSVRTQLRTKVAVAREGKTQLETLIERTRDLPPPGLELPADVRLPASLTFRDASSRDIYTAIARFANVNVVFDPPFREQPVTIDLRNTSLEDALQSLSTATRNFYRVVRAAHDHGHSGHAGQAPRVRGRNRPHLLPEQRRPQGNDRPAAHRHRRAAHRAGHGDQRDLDQGHAGARSPPPHGC